MNMYNERGHLKPMKVDDVIQLNVLALNLIKELSASPILSAVVLCP